MLSSFSGLIFWSLELVVELDCYSSAFKFKEVELSLLCHPCYPPMYPPHPPCFRSLPQQPRHLEAPTWEVPLKKV
ncbi:hypothetical protein LINGRAHAP2_LOCUS24628 [Linum grandiflorum]